jgi:integrase
VVARPFSAAELDQAWQAWSAQDSTLADVMLVLARTGLRWSEARALQVGDFNADCGAMRVDKAASEGTVTRALPTDRIRQVPVVDQVAGIVGRLAEGRRSDELLFTTNRGCQLHRTAVLRRLDWQRTGQGRRLHDLRHTAAHLWLVEGIDPDTVQEWMGHTLLVTEARTA